MGWFSDDSDDSNARASSSNQPQKTSDDEEDPLDAYMNSLDNTVPSSSRSHGERLDHDAEDEATSHWESKRPVSSNQGSLSRTLPSNSHSEFYQDDPKYMQSTSREAKLAISTTFVRAGNKRSHDKQVNGTDNKYDEPTIQSLEKQYYEMQHQEITPLEIINHKTKRYPPFRRTFLNPQNTNQAALWRAEHCITCNPPIDPILNFDQGIFPEALIKRIAKSGYDSPTLVQSQTLSVALAGRDGLITAATGSGKSKLLNMFQLFDN